MNVDALLELAAEHQDAGRLDQAEAIYNQILSMTRDVDALHLLGALWQKRGRHDLAIPLLEEAVAIEATYADCWITLFGSLSASGQTEVAVNALRRAAELEPRSRVWNQLGCLLRDSGRLDESIQAFERAVQCDTGETPVSQSVAHYNLGATLRLQGDWNRAASALSVAIALDPKLAIAHRELGNVLISRRQPDLAAEAYRDAIAIAPDLAEAHCGLGIALTQLGKLDEASICFAEALRFKPHLVEAHNNSGNMLLAQGRVREAIGRFQRALELSPHYAHARYNLSLALLLLGDFARGWEEYEWRGHGDLSSGPRRFPQPRWDGGDLRGRTILLHAEQGFGDTIQFCRYVPKVAAKGANVILQCQPELRQLLRDSFGITVISHDEPTPAFDVHCPLLSLPRAFDTRLENVPADMPCLSADPARAERWKSRLYGLVPHHRLLKVGLVWAGRPTHPHDRERSISIGELMPLLRVRGATFFSLQKGEAASGPLSPRTKPVVLFSRFACEPRPEGNNAIRRASQAKRLNNSTGPTPGERGSELVDLTAELHDFADTAAFITQLDLVISVDTAVAHLAGALGKRVWVMVPPAPDWRWMLERADSPWYPTMRLYRRAFGEDWSAVIARVAEDLAKWTRTTPRDMGVPPVPGAGADGFTGL